ncbi:ATP-binding protein, partial [Pseudomonas aeruginosa]|uniref:ATP-binding protein n=1 Tax=Pseudomonas aeruginosa TaxID=287 RepID=UPI0031B6E4BF
AVSVVVVPLAMTPSMHRAGAGLGLAIVKSIAEAHGGSVAVTSSELVTRFDLVLPHLRQ